MDQSLESALLSRWRIPQYDFFKTKTRWKNTGLAPLQCLHHATSKEFDDKATHVVKPDRAPTREILYHPVCLSVKIGNSVENKFNHSPLWRECNRRYSSVQGSICLPKVRSMKTPAIHYIKMLVPSIFAL